MATLNKNYSLYAVPAAWTIALLPHAYAISLTNSKSKNKSKFDITQPRSMPSRLVSDPTLDKSTKDRIIRAEGAQANGFENIGFFAASVVAGNLAGLSTRTLNMLSWGYVASRVVYSMIYINADTERAANARTAVFFGGAGLILTTFIMAGWSTCRFQRIATLRSLVW
jgi:uncharacterized MAPEG superfamily protein